MVSKYLLILVIVVAAIFIWRSNRKITLKERKAKQDKDRVVDMLPCRWCSIHVPQTDSVKGKHGSYCSAAHLRKAET
jgi:uncharacterized protein